MGTSIQEPMTTPNFKCEDVQPAVLMSIAEDETSADPKLLRQIKSCPSCSEKLEFFRDFHQMSLRVSNGTAPDLPPATQESIERMSRNIYRRLLIPRMKHKLRLFFQNLSAGWKNKKPMLSAGLFSLIIMLTLGTTYQLACFATVYETCTNLVYSPWKSANLAAHNIAEYCLSNTRLLPVPR